MASSLSFVEFVVDRARGAGALSFRKMFGEYALYLDGRVVALICDDQLFVRPTPEGRALLGPVSEAPPYPGAKLHFLIDEQLERPELLAELLRLTATLVPLPKPKKPGTPKGRKPPAPKK